MLQNMRCETCSTELNPSLELLEIVTKTHLRNDYGQTIDLHEMACTK